MLNQTYIMHELAKVNSFAQTFGIFIGTIAQKIQLAVDDLSQTLSVTRAGDEIGLIVHTGIAEVNIS